MTAEISCMQPRNLIEFRCREESTMTFGKKLETLRKQSDLSQEELADRLNVSRQAVSK